MYAEVLIEYKVKSLDRTFTYIIPEYLKNIIKPGMKVTVPFGLGDDTINGFVTKIKNDTNQGNLKSIIAVTDSFLVLNKELLSLGVFMKETYLCTLISAYQTMLPTSLKIKDNKSNYQKTTTYLVKNMPLDFIKTYINEVKHSSQKEILESLLEEDRILKNKYSSSSVQTLLKKGLIKEEKVEIYRIDKRSELSTNNLVLSPLQKEAYDEILKDFGKSSTFLLHGVTGSGKTEIYMRLIEEVVRRGKTAVMLVPEITLTAQIVDNFYTRFGGDVAILHSALSNGEKYDEYLKILRKDAHIVVGTRSAIFAPLENIGIIIVDEEQSESYKQDSTPRYNALDIAKYRSAYNNAPLVLGSATPTYETYARALKGVYKLITLPKRINNSPLPEIKIIDMQKEAKKRNTIISEYLKNKIDETLNKNEQVILLLNRRGYATLVNCDACGHTFKCPNCDITLTYHKTSNSLRCHYCGYFISKPDKCPECKEGDIRDFGLGTEKLESMINDTFKNAKVIRMDADTTGKKGSHERIIKDFKKEKYNILLGTQMISKGLDFPKVSLVGIISADASLSIPDFRSAEKTFALLNQVAGRAGRAGLTSEVVIQTYNPDNFTLKMVKSGTFLKNYQYEMSIRKALKYPPYYYLVGIKVCSRVYEDASIESSKVAAYLKKYLSSETIILGPTTAGIFKMNNIYRFQIVIKYRFDEHLLAVLKEIDEMYINHKSTYLEIDFNPYSI